MLYLILYWDNEKYYEGPWQGTIMLQTDILTWALLSVAAEPNTPRCDVPNVLIAALLCADWIKFWVSEYKCNRSGVDSSVDIVGRQLSELSLLFIRLFSSTSYHRINAILHTIKHFRYMNFCNTLFLSSSFVTLLRCNFIWVNINFPSNFFLFGTHCLDMS